jgi:hypothetical protein
MCATVFLASAHAAQAGINVWTSHGPPGGDVRALAIDPNTPSTLYAGTFVDGVFKSTDAGSTWNALNSGVRTVYALAIDPIPIVVGLRPYLKRKAAQPRESLS